MRQRVATAFDDGQESDAMIFVTVGLSVGRPDPTDFLAARRADSGDVAAV
jgi:hypothetical protein